jgi:hypothetical protein
MLWFTEYFFCKISASKNILVDKVWSSYGGEILKTNMFWNVTLCSFVDMW